MQDATQLAGARPDAKPTLLLVHGAWHGSWAWELVAPGLESAGWQVRTVDLPSTAERGGPRHDLYDDAAVVRAAIQEIDGPVVVGHRRRPAHPGRSAPRLVRRPGFRPRRPRDRPAATVEFGSVLSTVDGRCLACRSSSPPVRRTFRRLPSSHSPFISLPSELTELIVEAAANA